MEEELRLRFDAGQVPGWEDKGLGRLLAAPPNGSNGDGAAASAGIVDVEAFESSEELEIIGAERLKEALQVQAKKKMLLECQGPGQQSCQKDTTGGRGRGAW